MTPGDVRVAHGRIEVVSESSARSRPTTQECISAAARGEILAVERSSRGFEYRRCMAWRRLEARCTDRGGEE